MPTRIHLLINKHMGYSFHTAHPSGSNTQLAECPQSCSTRDSVFQQEETPAFPTLGTHTGSVSNVSLSSHSFMEPSVVKSNISPDAKSPGSTRYKLSSNN